VFYDVMHGEYFLNNTVMKYKTLFFNPRLNVGGRTCNLINTRSRDIYRSLSTNKGYKDIAAISFCRSSLF